MKFEVNVGSQHITFIVAFVAAIGLLGFVSAFGGTQPSTMGHSVGEIDWSQSINAGITANSVTAGTVTANSQLCVGSKCVTNVPRCEVLHAYSQDEVVANNIRQSIAVPSYCKNSKPCLIILKSLYNGVPTSSYSEIATKIYFQYSSTNQATGNNDGVIINGDSSSELILTGYNSNLGLYDDYSGVETDSDHWVYQDTTGYAGELITCPIAEL